MNFPLPVSDWELDSNIWNIESHRLKVDAVNVLHPTIQYGLAEELYKFVSAAELYGTIRSWRPNIMLATPTDPIYIVLLYESYQEIDFFKIGWSQYDEFKNYFLGNENKDWSKYGF